jgi:hypothetical protein
MDAKRLLREVVVNDLAEAEREICAKVGRLHHLGKSATSASACGASCNDAGPVPTPLISMSM